MFSTFSSMSSIITKRAGSDIEPCPDPGITDLLWYKFDTTNGIDNASTGKLKNYAGTMTDLSGALINAPTLNPKGTTQNAGFGSVTLGPGTPVTISSGKYIRVPLTILMKLPRANAFTISCWLKIPSNQLMYDIPIFALVNGVDYSNAFPCGIRTETNRTEAYFSLQGLDQNSRIPRYSSGMFYDDKWHLYTVTLNVGGGANTTTNLVTFYFDGVKSGTTTSSNITFQNYVDSVFGYLPWGGNTSNWTVPNIEYADIRIYNSLIPESQIRGLYRYTNNNHP